MSRKSTGFSPAVRELVHVRADGVCEILQPGVCTGEVGPLHHRRPRGMGGSKDSATNLASNALGICHHCHTFIETVERGAAQRHGWIVSGFVDDPSSIPVTRRGDVVMLHDDGTFTPAML